MVVKDTKNCHMMKNKGLSSTEKILQNQKKRFTIISISFKNFFVCSNNYKNYFHLGNLFFSDKHNNFFKKNIRIFFLWIWKISFSGKCKKFSFRQKSVFSKGQKTFFFVQKFHFCGIIIIIFLVEICLLECASIAFKIFSDFLMFYQIFISLQAKRYAIIGI